MKGHGERLTLTEDRNAQYKVGLWMSALHKEHINVSSKGTDRTGRNSKHRSYSTDQAGTQQSPDTDSPHN